MRLADDITIDLVRYLQRANHLFPMPRFYIGNYECDVFSTTQSGYTVEYEIKTSKADYYKDFEKSNAGRWAVRTEQASKILKHEQIRSGERTSRFIFVLPVDLIGLVDIPDYAGLLSYPDFETIKTGKLLHKRKANYSNEVPRDLANALFYRCRHYEWALRRVLDD